MLGSILTGDVIGLYTLRRRYWVAVTKLIEASSSWFLKISCIYVSFVSGGSLECGSDTPSAEALVGWLLEHQDLHVTELSEDSESLPSIEGFSDSDSMSDEFEDLEGAFGEVKIFF